MSLQERSELERIREARERYVARGVRRPALVVSRAEGARIWDADGTELHRLRRRDRLPQPRPRPSRRSVAAIHEQVDRYLHQCFMVGTYEPYVEVCRRLAELSPCGGEQQKSMLLNSGAEAVENAVKIARAATGRARRSSSSTTPSTAGRC